MKLISLNVGGPKKYIYKGKECTTSIFKSAVHDARQVSKTNIEGDKQSDLVNHGGELKAVYAYDVANYQHWKNIIARDDWGYGLFGENLTTEGLTDDTIYLGNIYQIGTVQLKAVQPRFPCFKLNLRFGDNSMLQQFTNEAKNGTYFSVVKEGTLRAGDSIQLIEQSQHKVTIQQLVDAYYNKGAEKEIVQQILAIDFLPERLSKAFKNFGF